MCVLASILEKWGYIEEKQEIAKASGVNIKHHRLQKVHFQRIVVIPHGLGHSNNRRHCDCLPYDRAGMHCIVEVSSSGPVVFEQTTEAPWEVKWSWISQLYFIYFFLHNHVSQGVGWADQLEHMPVSSLNLANTSKEEAWMSWGGREGWKRARTESIFFHHCHAY